MNHRVSDELIAMSVIFGERVRWCRPSLDAVVRGDGCLPIEICLEVPGRKPGAPLDLVFNLPQGYPDVLPSISIRSSTLSRTVVDTMAASLLEKSEELRGAACRAPRSNSHVNSYIYRVA